jgi:GH24 family phage-related lysozyme (muramidase)
MDLSSQDYAVLIEQLIDHEALRLERYLCSSNKWTIGVGYNISDRGLGFLEKVIGRRLDAMKITREEALKVLAADIDRIESEVRAAWPLYDQLDKVRKRAVIDFVFNIGTVGAAKFKSAIKFAEAAMSIRFGDNHDRLMLEACWTACAFHMFDSLWSRQVDDGLGGRKGRADRVGTMIRTGRDPKVT